MIQCRFKNPTKLKKWLSITVQVGQAINTKTRLIEKLLVKAFKKSSKVTKTNLSNEINANLDNIQGLIRTSLNTFGKNYMDHGHTLKLHTQ